MWQTETLQFEDDGNQIEHQKHNTCQNKFDWWDEELKMICHEMT
jgi:hypothetical protein